jgi:hypothetical protein
METPLTRQELIAKSRELDNQIAQQPFVVKFIVWLVAPQSLRKYLYPPKPKPTPCIETVYGLP